VRVTVCELRSSAGALEQDWDSLVAHVAQQGSELVVLPEMGFAPWLAAERAGSDATWSSSVAAHAAWSERLPELGAAVIGTRPVDRPAGRRNEAYLATPDGQVRSLHDKSYLPDEAGFWEASWYGRGAGGHRVVDAGGVRVGVLVCTEMWFLEHARAYGRAGAHLVVTPRVTPAYSLDKWLAGGRTSAVVSGAWSLSSNSAEPVHGGMGWAIDPEGVVVATTSRDQPWVTVEVDLDLADAAKGSYPRYVPEL
jgi:N-carbamoylputrescine amidase